MFCVGCVVKFFGIQKKDKVTLILSDESIDNSYLLRNVDGGDYYNIEKYSGSLMTKLKLLFTSKEDKEKYLFHCLHVYIREYFGDTVWLSVR
jgi:hypothetical protein